MSQFLRSKIRRRKVIKRKRNLRLINLSKNSLRWPQQIIKKWQWLKMRAKWIWLRLIILIIQWHLNNFKCTNFSSKITCNNSNTTNSNICNLLCHSSTLWTCTRINLNSLTNKISSLKPLNHSNPSPKKKNQNLHLKNKRARKQRNYSMVHPITKSDLKHYFKHVMHISTDYRSRCMAPTI